MKIFICDLQSAIDIEYMERESTIKETVEWDSILLNSTLKDKFINHINSMTFEQLNSRAETAADCGMIIESYKE